jgi:hypothetical protein
LFCEKNKKEVGKPYPNQKAPERRDSGFKRR